ncbi:MAG: sulfur carrier protein ThiS [Marinilabiliaceae bacterium]
MQITVNDKPVDFQGVTVAQLVAQLGLPETGVAVAIGMDIVPKTEWGVKSLAENDKVMIIKAASGG